MSSAKITIEEARKLIGEFASNYSNKEIEEIIRLMFYAAEFAYDEYIRVDHGE